LNKPIPNAPLLLSLAGLAPFFWGALTLANTDLMAWGQMWLGKGLVGAQVQISYSAVIMSFMSGVLWGFSTKTTQLKAAFCYTLSVLPALAVFFLISTNSENKIEFLMVGFGLLIVLDLIFSRLDLTPSWWLRLRISITFLVILSLSAKFALA
jgi:hypothetical protein